MDELDCPWFLGHGGDPVDESLLVGVGGVAGKGMHCCLHSDFMAINGDGAVTFTLFCYSTAQGAFGLITDKKDIGFTVVE